MFVFDGGSCWSTLILPPYCDVKIVNWLLVIVHFCHVFVSFFSTCKFKHPFCIFRLSKNTKSSNRMFLSIKIELFCFCLTIVFVAILCLCNSVVSLKNWCVSLRLNVNWICCPQMICEFWTEVYYSCLFFFIFLETLISTETCMSVNLKRLIYSFKLCHSKRVFNLLL